MPEVTVVTQPEIPVVPEEEPTWESVLSEIREAILSGFQSLRSEMTTEREANQALVSRLLESNTSLQSMITSANQTLMDKVTSLTLNPSPVPEVVVVTTPEVVPESVVEESQAVETSSLETAPVARRKRRIL